MKRRKSRKLDTNTLVMLKQIGWGGLIIAGALLVLTSIWYGTRLQPLTLSAVEVTGGETVGYDLVTRAAIQQLEGQYAGFIPRSFAWLYPKKEIIASLDLIERIHSIEVNRLNGTTLQVTFEEYLPEALWCKTLQAIECVFVDETGFAYSSSPHLAGGSLLRFIHTSQDPELNQSLTSKEDFQLLKHLADLLAENKWFISHIEIDKARDAFLHIVGGGEFKVTLTQDPLVTVNNLNVVLTSKEFSDVQPGNFQYIDLRFGNKVFVNEVPLTEIIEPIETDFAQDDSQEGLTEPDQIEAAAFGGAAEEEISPAEAEETETAASDDAAGE